ncbi:acyl-CoA dehydrogenase [Xanthobacteraceae bacterium Astr-EGSB]|uniref:acyl-CoA dehydrogenase n=1 Tax=Astrobacterium formosum TaxID=3069710 RepID=UPI0027AF90BC|nr:acyl-CoA dehydrogenase [Xanthobacteraceae bacterium Astr-EGSB]
MLYQAPIADIAFTLKHAASTDADRIAPDLDDETVRSVLTQAGRFAEEVIAPLDQPGDRHGARFQDGRVTTAPGFKEAYRAWSAAGWNGLSAPEQWGGQGLPVAVNAACMEMWNSAAMAFGLAPVLTIAGVNTLAQYGSDALKRIYLPKLVSGEWTGTMLLTEPDAGSDVGALRTRAERAGDGTYRLFGQKIFITYGDHDMADNIVHFVLARIPGAPPGTKGISLFLVPKHLVGADGAPGVRNDIVAQGIEHKLGLHGSPTCTMALGENGGAVGYLIGEENRGMAVMFTMMNEARLVVGVQGVAVAEAAAQRAMAYARERRQGRAAGGAPGDSVPIMVHPDVRRMLMSMRALTNSARAVCYSTAAAIDRSRHGPEQARRAAGERAALLTPVAKAYATDVGVEVANLGIQVHGGMGYVEASGAAQHFRDARITQIYEGTNGIQAIDLVTRKLPMSGGDAVHAYLDDLRATIDAVARENHPAFGATADSLGRSLECLARTTTWMMDRLDREADAALAGATPYLRLFGLTAGGCLLAGEGLTELREANGAFDETSRRVAIARFFAEHLAVQADGLERTIVDGAGALLHGADKVLD